MELLSMILSSEIPGLGIRERVEIVDAKPDRPAVQTQSTTLQRFWSWPFSPCKIADGALKPEVILNRSALRRNLEIQVVEGKLQCGSTVAAGMWPPASFENLGKIRLVLLQVNLEDRR